MRYHWHDYRNYSALMEWFMAVLFAVYFITLNGYLEDVELVIDVKMSDEKETLLTKGSALSLQA